MILDLKFLESILLSTDIHGPDMKWAMLWLIAEILRDLWELLEL